MTGDYYIVRSFFRQFDKNMSETPCWSISLTYLMDKVEISQSAFCTAGIRGIFLYWTTGFFIKIEANKTLRMIIYNTLILFSRFGEIAYTE